MARKPRKAHFKVVSTKSEASKILKQKRNSVKGRKNKHGKGVVYSYSKIKSGWALYARRKK